MKTKQKLWTIRTLLVLTLIVFAGASAMANEKQAQRSGRSSSTEAAQAQSSSKSQSAPRQASRQSTSRQQSTSAPQSAAAKSSSQPRTTQSSPARSASQASSASSGSFSQPRTVSRSVSGSTVNNRSFTKTATSGTRSVQSAAPAKTSTVRYSRPANRTVEVFSTAKSTTTQAVNTAAEGSTVRAGSVKTVSSAKQATRSRTDPVVIIPGRSTSQPAIQASAVPVETPKTSSVMTKIQPVSQTLSTQSRGPKNSNRKIKSSAPSQATETAAKTETSKTAAATEKTSQSKTAPAAAATQTNTQAQSTQSRGPKNSNRVIKSSSASQTNTTSAKTENEVKAPDTTGKTTSRTSSNTRSTSRSLQERTVSPIRVTSDQIRADDRTSIDVTDSVRTLDRDGKGLSRSGRHRSEPSADSNKTIIVNNSTVKAAPAQSTLDRDGGRPGRDHRRDDSPRIVINGNNNVIVEGNVSKDYHRPRISRRICPDITYIRRDPHWRSHHSGSYFSFRWSSSSCGVLLCLGFPTSSCYYPSWIRYSSRPYWYGYSYCYPRYHRRYIFVSPCGYWPSYYRYRRYYWYGCHPYYWYGTTVITQPSRNVTYNTYNYYGDNYDSGSTRGYYTVAPADVVDDYDEIRGQILDEPEYESPADLCFAHGVKIFSDGNYEDAAKQFREAVLLAPDDVVLPFTYSQALFADGNFAHAAAVLRNAIAQIPEEEMTIYYPRGLYEDEKVLAQQIDRLETAIKAEPFASDYHLLLGYQYLGLGQLDKVYAPLNEAAKDPANAATAHQLIKMAVKLEEEIAQQ